ncbi:MAG TPA: DinB family protein [Blastocatellia bacterium]|nr:DinB family protein [Blastocatellia bacterium]
MSEVAAILEDLKRIHDGDAWHGPALRDVLARVSPEQAAARPIAGAHSIWELVQHIAAWEGVFAGRLEGIPAAEPEEGDFPPAGQVTQEAWAQTLARLESAHQRLLSAVARVSDSALEETVVGRNYSTRIMLRGLIRHHVYHAGQITLLTKAAT